MKRKKPPRYSIVLNDIVFRLGVKEVEGLVLEKAGMKFIYCEELDQLLPLRFAVASNAVGQRFNVLVRPADGEVLLKLGEDDKLVEYIDVENGQLDVSNIETVRDLYEGHKAVIVQEVVNGMGLTAVAMILSIVVFILKLELFPWLLIPVCIALFGVIWSCRWYRTLNREIVYDALGNWINLATGTTSLNKGKFKYKL